MAHLPCFGACARATVRGASSLRRMLGMDRREHVLLAEEFVEVLLGLGIEARVMIRIPGMGRSAAGGGRAHNRLVDAADAARTGVETPDIIATFRISVTPSDEAGSANFLRRQ